MDYSFLSPSSVGVALIRTTRIVTPRRTAHRDSIPTRCRVVNVLNVRCAITSLKAARTFFHSILNVDLLSRITHPVSTLSKRDQLVRSAELEHSHLNGNTVSRVTCDIPRHGSLSLVLSGTGCERVAIRGVVSHNCFRDLCLQRPGKLHVRVTASCPNFALSRPLRGLKRAFTLPSFLRPGQGTVRTGVLGEGG